MRKSILTKSILAALSLPLIAGCVEREVVYRQAPPPDNAVVVEEPSQPPPPHEADIITPQPDPTFMWIGGAWEWRGRWFWVGGHWGPRPHPGAIWVRGGWAHRGHGYVWVGGHWR